MKIRMIMLLLVATFFVVFATNQNATAQEVISENLFQNPGFESGYYNQDQIAQIAVPNGWRMHWLDGQPFDGTNELPAYRPETVVWYIQDAPLEERSIFFRDGSYTLKIFKSWAPMYAALSQEVAGLEVGRKYRISAPIFVDIIEDYQGGRKVPPGDPRMGFVRFGAGPAGSAWLNASQINYSPYWTAENVNPFYQSMPIFIWDFVATSANMTIFIEMGSKYPFPNNGFFMDGVGLYALSETTAPPSNPGNPGGGGSAPVIQPTIAPIEVTPREDGSIVHVVGPNDSFWSIAIRYAAVLEMTAEEALPHIQQLNGNPQFVVAGQELLIRQPGAVNAQPTATPESESTEAESGEDATGEAPETETPEDGEDVIVVDGQPVDGETAVATEQAPTTTVGVVCVSAFEDLNGNGTLDSNEPLKADTAITLFKDSQTISTYITDGVTNEHCFEDLQPGSYQVQLFPPANYVATMNDSWAINVVEGVMVPVLFGVQHQPASQEVAELPETAGETGTTDTAVSPETSPTAVADAPAAEEEGGLMSNLGMIAVVIAGVLVLLAVAGVAMLRRG